MPAHQPANAIDRPNILWIMTDEQWAGAMSAAGNRDVATPAMDSLARTGVSFPQTYCTYPSCAPSRASLFTGLMPHETGVYDNHPEMTLNESCRPEMLGRLLSDAGYDCLYGGKWHLQDHNIPDGEFGFKKISDINDIELPGRCAQAFEAPRDRPFFLVASFDNPHNILEGARDVAMPWGEVDRPPIEDCPNLPANFAEMPYEPEAVIAERGQYPIAFRDPSYTADDWRWYRYLYYRLVEKVDAQVGKTLAALEAAGHADDTIVIFTSDHGDALGAHRWNQKWVLYEESVRVPLIIRDPRNKPRNDPRNEQGNVAAPDHLVSNGLDLYPTVCDYAGVTPPPGRRGRSLRALVDGQRPTAWRDHLPAETWWGRIFPFSFKTHGRMIRTSQYKYMMYSWGKYREQLFDLAADPGEMVNLAVESRFRDVLQQHRDLLAQHLIDTDDRYQSHYAMPGVLPRVPGQGYA